MRVSQKNTDFLFESRYSIMLSLYFFDIYNSLRILQLSILVLEAREKLNSPFRGILSYSTSFL